MAGLSEGCLSWTHFPQLFYRGGRISSNHRLLLLLARWAGRDPAGPTEEQVRGCFLHLIRDRQSAPQSIPQARAALTAFYMEMLGRTDWTVLASV